MQKSREPAERATAPISNVSLIVFNSVRLQELNELVAERNLMVMFLLSGNVLSYFFHIRLTHCERPIASLPRKVLQWRNT